MNGHSTVEWSFTDTYEPHMYRDGTEESLIESEEQLTQALRKHAEKDPRIIVMKNDGVGMIFVGLGASLGAVEYYADPSNHRAVTAKSKRPFIAPETWFVSEGEPSRFKHLLPLDEVIEVVVQIFRTGKLPDCVDWQ